MEIDEKQQKFEELAEQRVTAACHRIDLIGNLANKNSYHYTEKQVSEIFSAIDATIASVKQKFQTSPKAAKKAFKFGEADND